MPKIVNKGDPSAFENPIWSKISKKNNGDPLETFKNVRKKFHRLSSRNSLIVPKNFETVS